MAAKVTLALLDILLQTNGTTGWRGTYSTVPDTIDKVVTTFDTDPLIEGMTMRPELRVLEQLGLMIHVRAAKYDTGYDKIRAVCAALAAVSARYEPTIGTNGTYFQGFTRRSGPSPAGRAETDLRYMFSVNFTASIKEC